MSNCDSDSHREDIQAAIAPNEAGHDRQLDVKAAGTDLLIRLITCFWI